MFNLKKPFVFLTGSIGITSISYIVYSIYKKDNIREVNNENVINKENLKLNLEGKIVNGKNELLETNIQNLEEKKFTYEEISKHNKKNDVWVTYKNSVYNISNFIDSHPGGKDKIMLSAGKGLEPFWNLYRQHLKPEILNDILEPMKIGSIQNYDESKYKDNINLYKNEPERDNNLNIHTINPCNAELSKDNIINNWITPNNLWYIRNHEPVPKIDIANYKLNIYKLDDTKVSISLDYIKNMNFKEVVTTIQCGGNRRGSLNKYKKTNGTPWDIGAISTAKWKGVSLRNLIKISGIDRKELLDNYSHIHFESYDNVKISIPIEKGLNEFGDVILAYEMNGEELPRDHGYPLRLIVPGFVGIRNMKWIKSIRFGLDEVNSNWQTGLSYKGLPNYINDVKDIDLSKVPTILEQPVQSTIVNIREDNNNIVLNGYAYSGGGRGIIRVDVSSDNGNTWKMAELKEGSKQKFNRSWAWTFWEISFKRDEIAGKGCENIWVCKATDSSYNTQPKNLEDAWNIRGLNNNSWYRCKSN